MVRKELKKLINQDKRFTFTATVGQTGYYSNKYDPFRLQDSTVLLRDLYLIDEDNGKKYLTDHVWMKLGQMFKKADIQENDIIQFNARIDVYYKKVGFDSYEKDYRLVRPSKVINISRPDAKKEIPTIKQQQEEIIAQWQKEKQERIQTPITERQLEYIKSICNVLAIEVPQLKDWTKTQAHDWISERHVQYKELKHELTKRKNEIQKAKTQQRNDQINNDYANGISLEQLAIRYELKENTIKTIIRNHIDN